MRFNERAASTALSLLRRVVLFDFDVASEPLGLAQKRRAESPDRCLLQFCGDFRGNAFVAIR